MAFTGTATIKQISDRLFRITLIEAVWMTVNPVTDVTAPVPISIVKTGTTHLDFVATLHNDTAGDASGGLEIYVEFH